MIKRKNTRLKNYDYSQSGYYFITVCTYEKQHLFGKIIDNQIMLNEYGKIVHQELLQIPSRFSHVKLDKFVVMPNHIHIIIVIVGNGLDHSAFPDNHVTQAERSRPFPTIPKILGLYKSGSARRIHELNNKITVWQKSYYDHIIRKESEYREIRQYIDTNPLKWEIDAYFNK